MKHNAEAEAIDLLMEVGRLDELVAHVDKTNCDRICAYLAQLAMCAAEPLPSPLPPSPPPPAPFPL